MNSATLTTLTPVHVGSGQTLQRGFDFIQKNSQVGFLDLDKIVARIGEVSIPQLTAQIEQRKPIMDLPALRNVSIKDISSRVADAADISTNAQELKEHYRTSMQGLCIPGSSIKGAIKTALWETLMTDEKANAFRAEDLKNNYGKWKSDRVDVKLFGKDANTKTTRFVKVGDCSFGDQPSEVLEVGIYNSYFTGWDFKKETLLAEVIPPNATATFSLKLDTLLLERNESKYPSDWNAVNTSFVKKGNQYFCNQLNSYMLKQLEIEIYELDNAEFGDKDAGEGMLYELENLYNLVDDLMKENKPAFILRVGGHSGWNFTTGGWMKKEEIKAKLSKTEYSELRRNIQKRDYVDMELWPKTRKMNLAGMPLGFVKIEFS